jgi:hypothetical protein
MYKHPRHNAYSAFGPIFIYYYYSTILVKNSKNQVKCAKKYATKLIENEKTA